MVGKRWALVFCPAQWVEDFLVQAVLLFFKTFLLVAGAASSCFCKHCPLSIQTSYLAFTKSLVSITTVAFHLSTGRMTMLFFSFSVLNATLSSLIVGGGGLDLFRMLQTLPHSSVASSSFILQSTPTTAAISRVGIFCGAGQKFKPRQSTVSLASVRSCE